MLANVYEALYYGNYNEDTVRQLIRKRRILKYCARLQHILAQRYWGRDATEEEKHSIYEAKTRL